MSSCRLSVGLGYSAACYVGIVQEQVHINITLCFWHSHNYCHMALNANTLLSSSSWPRERLLFQHMQLLLYVFCYSFNDISLLLQISTSSINYRLNKNCYMSFQAILSSKKRAALKFKIQCDDIVYIL